MAKGVNIPLTISGLREARENLEKLNQEIEKTEDVKVSQKLTKQYNELSSAIDDTTESLKEMNAAGELAGTKFDDLNEVLFQTNEEVLPLTSQIGEMEDRMYQLAQANQQGSKEFIELQKKVVSARKTIIETDRSIDAMTENVGSLGGITSAFGELGEAVFNLDFKRAGVAVKGLSTQFAAFGKVLLANPIFLIVAIVAAIVVAIITFKDKVKFLSDIFDALGKVIDVVIQALKDFLDWIGLTNFAEQDLAAERQKRAEQNLENIKAQGDAVQSQFDRQIALAQAEGKSTFELEKKKQEAIIATAEAQKEQLKVLTEQLRIQGKLTEEETKKIKAQRIALEESIKTASNNIKILEINNSKKVKEEEKKDLDTRRSNYEQYKNNRISAARKIQDLELQLMAEGREKELLQNEIAFERLREETLENEKLTREEKLELNNLYDNLEAKSKFDILANNLDQELEIRRDHEANLQELSVLRTEFEESEASKRIARDKATNQQLIANVSEYATGTVNALNSINNLANVLGENRLKNVKEGSKAEEKIRKQMFVRQKALNLAMAAIDGFKAITASLAQAPIAIGAVPNPAGIASLAFAIAQTGASIAAIAAQRFEGGGSKPSASTPSIGGGGGGATSASASTPSFELFGQPNEDNNVSAAQAQELTPTVVKAVVVESDITTTQNKVSKMKENAEL
jgi:hypothetical protein